MAYSAGTRLHNAGSWIFDAAFMRRGPGSSSPYWPGGAIALDDDGPPRLERLLGDVPALGRAGAIRPIRARRRPSINLSDQDP